MESEYESRRVDGRTSVWTAIAAACAAGLTTCITLLYLGAQFVMSQGGFVAVGGPCEIAHPAPSWIALVPASILAGFALGGDCRIRSCEI